MPSPRPQPIQSAPARLAAFAVLLALAFGGSWALGSAVGPTDDAPAVVHTGVGGATGHDASTAGEEHR